MLSAYVSRTRIQQTHMQGNLRGNRRRGESGAIPSVRAGRPEKGLGGTPSPQLAGPPAERPEEGVGTRAVRAGPPAEAPGGRVEGEWERRWEGDSGKGWMGT